jgi:hypothetical protein
MTQINNTSLLEFYNLLLEAERAGVKVLGELLSQTEDQHLLDLLKKFLRDEGVNCRILIALIHDLGAEPSVKTGDFVEKVLALDSLKEQIDLLVRGQEWVARKIREFRHLLPAGSPHLFMEAIKVQHEENVDTLNIYFKKH